GINVIATSIWNKAVILTFVLESTKPTSMSLNGEEDYRQSQDFGAADHCPGISSPEVVITGGKKKISDQTSLSQPANSAT
ncbi:hypothetical protein HAX54_049614, partial [Datura stramonium]|nr:hypothetical protein [Datura stramonium]